MTFRSRSIERAGPEPVLMRIVKPLILVTLAIHLVAGAVSAYRAYVQVRSLDLRLIGNALQTGTTVRVDVRSSGRVPVDVGLELVQGARSETLAVLRVPNNRDPFWDPRIAPGSLSVVISPDLLARFKPGPGLLRATARGRSQWLRVPPPLVRELPVEIQHTDQPFTRDVARTLLDTAGFVPTATLPRSSARTSLRSP